MTTTWLLILAALASLAGIAVLVKPSLLHRSSFGSWSPPVREMDKTPKAPVVHVGATEKFGAELKALKNAPVDPNLVSDTEMDLQWGLAWHAFEHDMQEEIDRVFAPLLAALPVADDFDELREQTCPKELMPA